MKYGNYDLDPVIKTDEVFNEHTKPYDVVTFHNELIENLYKLYNNKYYDKSYSHFEKIRSIINDENFKVCSSNIYEANEKCNLLFDKEEVHFRKKVFDALFKNTCKEVMKLVGNNPDIISKISLNIMNDKIGILTDINYLLSDEDFLNLHHLDFLRYRKLSENIIGILDIINNLSSYSYIRREYYKIAYTIIE